MRYYVTLSDREIPVEIAGSRVVVGGREFQAELRSLAGTPLRHLVAGPHSLPLVVEGVPGHWALIVKGTRYEVGVVDERTRHLRGLTGARAARGGGGELRAPMPGLVVRVLVEAGQAVEAGQGMVVLEAMKMENELRAASAGVVVSVPAQPGQAVERGQLLVAFQEPGGAPHP